LCPDGGKAVVDGALVEAEGAEKRYGRSGRPAISAASLEVFRGAAIGIVGESGSGKSTLARMLAGATEPTAGSVLVAGRKWAQVKRHDPLRKTVQMIFQDPYSSLNPSLTGFQTVAEVFHVWGEGSKSDARDSARRLLEEVGISERVQSRRPLELSGGQRQRVAIARALACEPSVLIADEPTSSLDVSVQAKILNLLGDMRESRGLSLILVSHDLSVVRHMTDEVLVVYSGKVVERGSTSAILEQPHHPYTRLLLNSVPGSKVKIEQVRNRIAAEPACSFAARCPRATEECVNVQPPRYSDDRGGYVECHHPMNTPAASAAC
jgi:oligopeptide/dipeptide ABC transporter ATP-binding protein